VSRRPALDIGDRDVVELRDLADRPTRDELDDLGPADGCTGSPLCRCVDCDRVPTGGHFAFECRPVDDFGLEDW
jgi:hypothetical protein